MKARAWMRRKTPRNLERARDIGDFTYRALSPDRGHEGNSLREVLAGGSAWCSGYALAAGLMMRQEGYRVRWVTMVAEGHPRIVSHTGVNTHAVIEVADNTKLWGLFDPMVNLWFDASLAKVLDDPTKADVPRTRDARYVEREYELYATSVWYGLVTAVALRNSPWGSERFGPPGDIDQVALPLYLDLLRVR